MLRQEIVSESVSNGFMLSNVGKGQTPTAQLRGLAEFVFYVHMCKPEYVQHTRRGAHTGQGGAGGPGTGVRHL